jgi:hypothetical protein
MDDDMLRSLAARLALINDFGITEDAVENWLESLLGDADQLGRRTVNILVWE